MRDPRNNPTERIIELLREYEELRLAYDSLNEIAQAAIPLNQLNSLPQPPSPLAFEKELMRQGRNYRVRPEILKARQAMQRRRIIDSALSSEAEIQRNYDEFVKAHRPDQSSANNPDQVKKPD